MVNCQSIPKREIVKESWLRCINLGLCSKDLPNTESISLKRLESILKMNRQFLNSFIPYIEELELCIPKKDALIGIANADGIILHITGDSPDLNNLGFRAGSIVVETSMGNNSIGTCIETDEPVIIMGEEHYLEALRDWNGCSVPVHNYKGDIIGILFLEIPCTHWGENYIAMLMMAARGVEKELKFMNERAELVTITEVLSDLSEGMIKTAAMLSHEIRNSLSNISAYVQLLELEKTLENHKGNRILGEISRVNKLLDDFKSITKSSKFNMSGYCLNKLLSETLELVLPKAIMNNVEIDVDISNKSINVKMDRDAIQQVIINMIENAVQAINGEGNIYIRLYPDEKRSVAVIEFEDNGSGIKKEDMSNIFKMFYTTKKTGSGLGLALCLNIIKEHGGDIKVDSTPGVGTTFRVELPYSN